MGLIGTTNIALPRGLRGHRGGVQHASIPQALGFTFGVGMALEALGGKVGGGDILAVP